MNSTRILMQTLGTMVIIALLLFPSLSSAADIKYFYDNSGRLVRAISEADEATVYAYDEVGNLLSISKQTLSQAPPKWLKVAGKAATRFGWGYLGYEAFECMRECGTKNECK